MALGINSSGPRKSNIFDPVIRPKGSETQSDVKPFALPKTQQANTASEAAPITKTAPVSSPDTVKPAESKPIPSTARPLDKTDIINFLVNFQKSPTQENQTILSYIIQHGLEASLENFDTVTRLLQGKNKPNAPESAVVSVLKGLADVPKSVDILGTFVANNPQIALNLDQVQGALKQLQQSLQQHQGLFDVSLFTGFIGILSTLDDNLKKLNKKAEDGDMALGELKRGELLNDVKVLTEFLGGLEEKIQRENPQDSPLSGVRQNISQLKEKLTGFLDNLTAQVILSKESGVQQLGTDKFMYLQMPNPLTEKPSNIELLIKKDPQKNGALNPAKTRIIAKFDTPDLGELSVTLDVADKKVWYLFYTQNSETKSAVMKLSPELKEQMSALDYEVMGIQAVEKKLDIKKLVLPTLNLDKLSRINAEV